MNASTAASFWSINRTVMDSVPILRNLKYQMATVKSQKGGESGKPKDAKNSSVEPTLQEVCHALNFLQLYCLNQLTPLTASCQCLVFRPVVVQE